MMITTSTQWYRSQHPPNYPLYTHYILYTLLYAFFARAVSRERPLCFSSIVASACDHKGLCPEGIKARFNRNQWSLSFAFLHGSGRQSLCKSYQWREWRHNLGVNAKRENVLPAFPPLIAGHKNNGRTDKSGTVCPYNTHNTAISGNQLIKTSPFFAFTMLELTNTNKNTFIAVAKKIPHQNENNFSSKVWTVQISLSSPITGKNIQKPETCGFVGRQKLGFVPPVCLYFPLGTLSVLKPLSPPA